MKTIKHKVYNTKLFKISISALLWLITICTAHAQDIDCDLYGNLQYLNILKKEEVLQLQRQLMAIGHTSIPEDGVVGQLTIGALQDYCRNREKSDEMVSYQITEKKLNDIELILTSYTALNAIAPGEDKKAVSDEVAGILSQFSETFTPPLIQKVYPPTGIESDANVTSPEVPSTLYGPNNAIINHLRKRLIPEPVIKAIKALQGREFATETLFNNAVVTELLENQKKNNCAETVKMQTQNKASDNAGYTETVQKRVHQEFRVLHDIETFKKIHWKSTPCGCVPDLTKETYGLYPFWLLAGDESEQAAGANDKKAQIHAIEFGALTRIGYYSLFMNSDGSLRKASLWETNTHRAGFIRKAHKYRTNVDLVITMPDWYEWYTRVENSTYREQMINTITEVMTIAPKFDGVTLYFRSYPLNKTHAESLREFLLKLRNRLSDHKKYAFVNLMLPPILKKNENDVSKFFGAIYPKDQDINDASNPINLIITFLHEPTSCWKKEMRYIMEKMYKGETRKKMIRKIVPIIQLPQDSKNTQEIDQFKDDLIYLEDNFGGVGFWPVPSSHYKGLELDKLTAMVLSAFELKENLPFLERSLKNRSQALCRFVCPNRQIIKIIFFSILLFLGVYTVGSSWICELRGLFNKFFWYFMALILFEMIILGGLLACDPIWMKNSTEIFIILVGVMTIFIVFRQIRKMKEAEYP